MSAPASVFMSDVDIRDPCLQLCDVCLRCSLNFTDRGDSRSPRSVELFQYVSELAPELAPPSTWTAFTGNGMPSRICTRNAAASQTRARSSASATRKRLLTSMAVNG